MSTPASPQPHPPAPSEPVASRIGKRLPGCLASMLLGAAISAVCGAIGRAMVALIFIYLVDAGNGSFFANTFSTADKSIWEVIVAHRALLLISGSIGLVVCGLAGATGREYIAAPVGALLSGTPCFVLAVFPSMFFMAMSGGNNEPDQQAVITALILMIIVGAVASAAGPLVARFAIPAIQRSRHGGGGIL